MSIQQIGECEPRCGMDLLLPRRSFLTGLGLSLLAAPAVVRAASLMPVRTPITLWTPPLVVVQWDARRLMTGP